MLYLAAATNLAVHDAHHLYTFSPVRAVSSPKSSARNLQPSGSSATFRAFLILGLFRDCFRTVFHFVNISISVPFHEVLSAAFCRAALRGPRSLFKVFELYRYKFND